MSKMFSPDTLKSEYHESLKRKLTRNMIASYAVKRVMDAREKHPQIYMDLATLAHIESDNAFRLGLRIFMDALYPGDYLISNEYYPDDNR